MQFVINLLVEDFPAVYIHVMVACFNHAPVIINRPQRSTTRVDATYCYERSSVVSLSVGLSVAIMSPAKTAEPIEMPFGL